MTKVNVSKRVKGLLAGGFLVGSLLASGLACNDTDRAVVNGAREAVQTVQTGVQESKEMLSCMADVSGAFNCAIEQSVK